MDFFKFSIYSIICLIFVHFIFYFHNVDIIEWLYGSSNHTSHTLVKNKAEYKGDEQSEQTTQTKNDAVSENNNEECEKLNIEDNQHNSNSNEENINRENHIKELLQGLEELQDR